MSLLLPLFQRLITNIGTVIVPLHGVDATAVAAAYGARVVGVCNVYKAIPTCHCTSSHRIQSHHNISQRPATPAIEGIGGVSSHVGQAGRTAETIRIVEVHCDICCAIINGVLNAIITGQALRKSLFVA